MSLRLPAVIVALVFATASAMAAQNPRDAASLAAPTGIISGVVTAADTGMPLHGAEVRVEGENIPRLDPRRAVTDELGRYEVRALDPGRYIVSASKVGYVMLSFGQRRPAESGRPVDVAGSGAQDEIDFTLPRGGTIVARITDPFGDPLAGISVRPFESRFAAGRRQLQPVVAALPNVTDDRGEVRLFGLPPGEYYLAALPPAPRQGYAETLHPGTSLQAEARPVRVGLGEEASVTFPMARSSLASISGVIVGSTGPLVDPSVTVQHRQLGGTRVHSATVLADGTFSAKRLPPGDYVIRVSSPEFAVHTVRVFGKDVNDIVMTTKRAGTVRARITFDADRAPADPVQLRAAFVGPGCGLGSVCEGGGSVGVIRAATAANRTFNAQLAGVGVLRLSRPSTWFLKAVLIEGEDVTDTPLDFAAAYEGKSVEIVLTQRVGEVAGTITDDRGQVMTDSSVVLFPEDAEQWTEFSRFIATARQDQHGRFALRGLPPGKYLIAALEYLEPGEERNPETLARLRAGATALSLAEGESRAISLRLDR